MENKSYALAVGIFILLLTAGTIWAFIWFKGDDIPQTPYYVVTNSAVSGLSEGSDVRLRGLKVGKILNFRFNPANRHQVLIKINVNSDVPITSATYARTVFQGITGQGAIELFEPQVPHTIIKSSPEHIAIIPMRPSVIENVTTYARELAKETQKVLAQLDKLLNDKNVRSISATLLAAQQTSEKLPAFVESLEKTNQTLNLLLQKTDALMSQNVAATLNDFRGVAVDAQQVLNDGKQLIKTLDQQSSQLSGNLDGVLLPKVNTTLEELGQTSESLKYFMNDLTENPSSLIVGVEKTPGPGEPGFNGGNAK